MVINPMFPCPQCGRNIQFSNCFSNHIVCSCGNLVYKAEDELPVVKFINVISQTGDIIQPGSEGIWNGRKFMVTGRFRLWFEENAFNYWTIDFNDDKRYYLAEGYGLYSICENFAFIEDLKSRVLDTLKLDSTFTVDSNKHFTFLRKNEVRHWDVEGTFYKKDADTIRVFDAEGDDGLITILEFGKNIVETYHVYPTTFEDLQLSRLRQTSLTGKKFICASCNYENTVRNYPYAQSWACNSCGTCYSLENTGLAKREGRASEDIGFIGHYIPLDTEFILSGVKYRVVGFACKEDSAGHTGRWQEYTLMDEHNGYAFLNESDGHWMIVKETLLTPPVGFIQTRAFLHEGKTFQLFSKYHYYVIAAAGEFPGNIFNDNFTAYAYDFIAPPELWSAERGRHEGITWFRGKYVNRKELKKQTGAPLPRQSGIGMLQPGGIIDIPLLIRTTLVILLIAIGIHIFLGATSKEHVLVNQDFEIRDTLAAQTFVTHNFELKKWKSNLEFEFYAPVDNSWLEVGATLVNVKTGDEYSLEQGVEYYHGYTDGENWSEGSQRESAYLSSIPAGTYFLRMDGMRDAGVTDNKVSYFHAKVVYDVPMFRNLMLTILVLLLYPVLVVWISTGIERKRWYGSDYSRFSYNN